MAERLVSSANPEFPATSSAQEGDYVPMVRPAPETIYKFPIDRLSGSRSAFKTEDESVTNSSTLQDDAELVLALEAGRYRIEGFLRVTPTGSSGFKSKFAGGATLESLAVGMWSGSLDGTMVGYLVSADTPFDAVGDQTFVAFSGTCVVTTAGTLVLQWAQSDPDVGLTLTVHEDSFMTATKIG